MNLSQALLIGAMHDQPAVEACHEMPQQPESRVQHLSMLDGLMDNTQSLSTEVFGRDGNDNVVRCQ